MLEDITTEQIKNQFKSNKTLRYAVLGVGALVIAVLGYFSYRQFFWKPANEKSMESYWVGLNYAKIDSTDVAIDELRPVVNKYDGKVGGEVAQFVLARQMMNKGEFKKALEELESVDLEDTYLQVMGIGLQGDCLSEMEQYDKAATKYLEAADMIDNDLTTPMYLWKAGLCAEEVKNFDKATECYQRIKDDYPAYSARKAIDKYIARASSKTTKKN